MAVYTEILYLCHELSYLGTPPRALNRGRMFVVFEYSNHKYHIQIVANVCGMCRKNSGFPALRVVFWCPRSMSYFSLTLIQLDYVGLGVGPTVVELCFSTLLEPQSRFGDIPLKFQVVFPQNGTAVF